MQSAPGRSLAHRLRITPRTTTGVRRQEHEIRVIEILTSTTTCLAFVYHSSTFYVLLFTHWKHWGILYRREKVVYNRVLLHVSTISISSPLSSPHPLVTCCAILSNIIALGRTITSVGATQLAKPETHSAHTYWDPVHWASMGCSAVRKTCQ